VKMISNIFCLKSIKRLFNICIVVLAILLLALSVSSHAEQLKNGSLSINSNPKGAAVYLDNDFKGNTPLDIKNLETGQYNLKMILAGYEDWNSTVVVLPVLTVRISADLVPSQKKVEEFGSISVNSNPQGAKVYLDNNYTGDTPLNIRNVPVGRHNIRVELSGFEDWVTNITVSASQVERISMDLKSRTSVGSIAFNSIPQGADIYLNDVYEGLTPLNLTNINTGKYEVKISLQGYEDWFEEIEVSPSLTTRVYAELISEPQFGSITIYCDQKEAKVFMNGTYQTTINRIPVTIDDVKSRDYEIVIIKDGFRAWVRDIEIFPGEETSIDVQMTKILE
ncbi:MAG: PEGA domain-containing protein, partial [Candidatus Caldatribacteriota bacterium]